MLFKTPATIDKINGINKKDFNKVFMILLRVAVNNSNM